MTELQAHIAKWKTCTACPFHALRKNVVIGRGAIPCDVLFIGEAPGESEDVLGYPFAGRAGKLLTHIIGEALEGKPLRIAYTNVICCIPYDELMHKLAEGPTDESMEACEPRLIEFVRIAKPRLLILVGKHAKKRISGQAMFYGYDEKANLWRQNPLEFQEITHPAAILRTNVMQQEMEVRRCVVRLRESFQRLY